MSENHRCGERQLSCQYSWGKSEHSGKGRGKQRKSWRNQFCAPADSREKAGGKNESWRLWRVGEKVEISRPTFWAGEKGAPPGERDAPPNAGPAVWGQLPIEWVNERLSWDLGRQAERPWECSQQGASVELEKISLVSARLVCGRQGEGRSSERPIFSLYGAALFLRTCAILFVSRAPLPWFGFLCLQEPAERISTLPLRTTFPSPLPSFCFGNTFQTHTWNTNIVLASCLSFNLHIVDIKSFCFFFFFWQRPGYKGR